MTGNKKHKLGLTILLGMTMLPAGCRSRAELFESGPVHSPTRTVAATPDEPEAAPPAEQVEGADPAPPPPGTDGASMDDSSTRPEPDPSATPAKTTPAEILEAAGIIIERDKHGRAVGADGTEASMGPAVAQALAELSELQWLDLRGADVSDTDLAVIGKLPRLELLALGNTRVTDEGLRHLSQQQDLRFLSLDGTAISDAGLAQLVGLPRLEGVSLSGTSVTRQGARQFEEQKPGCRAILDKDAPETAPVSTPVPEPIDPAPGDVAPGEPTSRDDGVWNLDNGPQPREFPEPQQPVAIQARIPSASSTAAQLNQVLQQKLMEPDVVQALTRHLMAQQQYDKATIALQALVALQPDNHQARFDLGVALARTGQFETAKPHLSAVVGEATTCYNLGVIAYDLKQPTRSEWYFAQALKAAPEFAEAQQWLDRLRQTTLIAPASHTPQPVVQQDLVNLLMSELGAGETKPNVPQTSNGIEIVPASTGKAAAQ